MATVYRNEHGKAVLVVREGRKLLHAIIIAPPVRLITLEKAEMRFLAPLQFKGRPYPIARARRRFAEAGRALGITKGARDALRSI